MSGMIVFFHLVVPEAEVDKFAEKSGAELPGKDATHVDISVGISMSA
jgi:hypothetical protein